MFPKKNVLKNFLLLFSISMVVNIFSQNQNVDSLLKSVEIGVFSNKELIEIYLQLCNAYQFNNKEKLMIFANKGMQLSKNENNMKTLSNFYLYMGIGFVHYGEIDSAKIYYEKGIDLAIETKNKECELLLYENLSFIHNRKINYKDDNLALEYLLKALKIAEEVGNKKIITHILFSLCEFYHRVFTNYERYEFYLKRAEKIVHETNDSYGKMQLYYYKAIICDESRAEYDNAIKYALHCLEISRQIENKKYEVFSLQRLGYIYCLKINDFNKAEEYALECLRVAEEFDALNELILAYTVLSFVYLYQRRFDDCKKAVLKAWAMDSLNINLSTLTNLAAAYLYSGELDEAHTFFIKYVNLLENYSGKQFQKHIADMEIKYETEKKETRIDTLEKERTLYIWIFIATAIILMLCFGLLMFLNMINVQKRKLYEQQREISEQKINQLEQENQLIATQAILDGETAERSRLARDLHDGLGGMLSVVKLNLKDMNNFAIIEGIDTIRFGNALDMLDKSIGELRRVAHHIMPESLMRYGLKVSLEDFCHAVPGAIFHYLGENQRLDSRLEVLIYRCAYELVNNAIKHAKADSINVQLMIDNNITELTVQDNGIGFDPKMVKKGMGLENIRTRIAIYNGKMNIDSSYNNGTEISIEIEL